MTEEEIIYKSSAIVKARVVSISREEGAYTQMCRLKILKVYKGDIETREIYILTPPFDIEDTEILGNIKEGSNCIFILNSWNIPYVYEGIPCEYRLGDGMRYVFIETDKGIIYDRNTIHLKQMVLMLWLRIYQSCKINNNRICFKQVSAELPMEGSGVFLLLKIQ